MNGTDVARSRQIKTLAYEFDGTPMDWLSGARDVRQKSKFQFLRLAVDEIQVVKQAAMTLAAMRFVANRSRYFFAGADRISEITGQSTKTIYTHWESLEKVGLVFRRKSYRSTTEFRLAKDSEADCLMLPIGFANRASKFSEQILFSMVISNLWKLLTIEELSLGDACINQGLTKYLVVSKSRWEEVTGMNISQLFRAKSSLVDAKIITAHGDLKNILLPYGTHDEVDDLRSALSEKGYRKTSVGGSAKLPMG